MKIVATYDYQDEKGKVVYRVSRFKDKDFRAFRPDGRGGIKGITRVLYRLPQLIAAKAKTWVCVVEGEKDVDNLTKLGVVATTCVFGGGKWKVQYNPYFKQRRVLVIADNDGEGLKHAINVVNNLLPVVAEVRVLVWPDSLPVGYDVSDWIDDGGNKTQLLKLIDDSDCITKPMRVSKGAGKGKTSSTKTNSKVDSKIATEGRNDHLRKFALNLKRNTKLNKEQVLVLTEKENERRYKDKALGKTELLKIVLNAFEYDDYSDHIRSDDYLKSNQAFAANFCVQRFQNQITYCVNLKKWYFWDGTRWCGNKGYSEVKRRVIQTIQKVVQNPSPDQFNDALKWTNRMLNNLPIEGVLNLIAIHKEIEKSLADYDQNDYLLNCLNGTIDLRTGKLRSHNPNDFITKLCPVHYKGTNSSKLWKDFISCITCSNRPLQKLLQNFLGYSLTGDTTEERFALMHGETWTGKSTLMEPIKRILGDYVTTIPFETFVRSNNPRAPRPFLAKLPGARLIVCSEFPEKGRLDIELIKNFVAGEQISTRDMHGKKFDFYPKGKIVFCSNYIPHIPHDDKAMWRRTKYFPFEHSFGNEKNPPDDTIKKTLKNIEHSGSAVIGWLVKGCINWQKVGLPRSKKEVEGKEQHRQLQDPLKDYFESEIVVHPKGYVLANAFYPDYVTYCNVNRIKYQLGRPKFNRLLESKGYKKSTRHKQAVWLGIRLKGLKDVSNPDNTE